jgi:hypothetical protein
MAKSKKQQRKIGSWIRKVWFDEEHSETNHDSESKKHMKKNAKRERRIREKDSFDKE